MEHVLEIKDLSITLNDNAILKNIDMHVDAGEIVGFIGDNGSGKSTTMKAIANLVFPAPDTISISGFDVRRHSTEALKSLSAVIEEPVFFENLSGADNLSIMANLRHTPLEDVMVFIHDYQMEAHLKRKVRRYSQGMRKRLALCPVSYTHLEVLGKKVGVLSGGELTKLSFAKLFVSDCNVLLIDEPSNYLDIPSYEAIEALLLDFEGSMLFTSHDAYFVETIADTIFELKDRKLVRLK